MCIVIQNVKAEIIKKASDGRIPEVGRHVVKTVYWNKYIFFMFMDSNFKFSEYIVFMKNRVTFLSTNILIDFSELGFTVIINKG